MARTILVVGTSLRSLPLYLQEHGYQYIVLKDSRFAKKTSPLSPYTILCDFSTPASMLDTVAKIAKRHRIDGVITTYERYILATATIAAYLKLPGLPLASAKVCTDKLLMREQLVRVSEPISPAFAMVASAADIKAFAARHPFPLMLKPANLSKSLLVFKNNSLGDLMNNYDRMMATITSTYNRYAPNQVPRILIEEYMEGSVHSVDAFVDSAGVPHVLEEVVDYQTGYDIGYADNFHYSRLLPSTLPADKIMRLRHVAELGCNALGMRNSPAHIEVIYTHRGPRIVEIAARYGGYRERMYKLANNIDITGSMIALALGGQPHISAVRNEPVGVFELFPKVPGTFVGVANEATLKSLASLVYYSLPAKEGMFVGKSSDGYKASAIVILHHADQVRFAQDMAYLNQHITILTV